MIDNTLDIIYSHKPCYLALSLLYNQAALIADDLHIDHIFPRSLFESKNLRQRGLSEAFGEQCRLLLDKLGNLQLLPARENLEKSDLQFHQWMDTRSSSFVETHLIPRDSALWAIERFPEFIAERNKLIRSRLVGLMRQPAERVSPSYENAW